MTELFNLLFSVNIAHIVMHFVAFNQIFTGAMSMP